MSEKTPHLSVIIPAYNEAKRIGNTLLDVDKYLSEQDYSYEILVVIDSTGGDNTSEVVDNYKKLVKNLEYLVFKGGSGKKGLAVRMGMLKTTGKWRLFMDADSATTIDHLEKFWPLVDQGFEVLITSRDKKDVKGARQAVKQPLFKRMLGNFGNILTQIFGVWGIWDTQNGFKMLSAKATEDIFSRAKVNGFGFDIELLALAKKLGYKIGIAPANLINDPNSRVTLSSYLYVFMELLKIRWNLITDKYNVKKDKTE